MVRKRALQVIKMLMTWGLPLALLFLAGASLPISSHDATAPQINREPFYYALSTIAQVAAALAALIGFLGQWWLGRLRDEETRIEQKLREIILQDSSLVSPADLSRLTGTFLLQIVDRVIKAPQGLQQTFMATTLRFERARSRGLPDERKRLIQALQRFLRGTLAIMVIALIALVFVDALLTRPWIWIVRAFIIGASVGLGIGPAYVASVMWKEVPWGPLVPALLLLLVSPALAGPVRCLTYEEKTLDRVHTVCADGTRGVSIYNRTLQRWETTLTPPGKTCSGRLNPKTQQGEGRCR